MAFDVLVTIMGSLDSEAEALALIRQLEDCVSRAGRLGIAIDVRDLRQGKTLCKRIVSPVEQAPA